MDYSISYYQWIPLFFMMLAMCFYVPRAVWFNVFAHHFIDINSIVDLLTSFDNAVNPETRDPAVKQVAYHINRYLTNTIEYRKNAFFQARTQLAKSNTFFFYMGRRYGLEITLVYLIVKFCYIIVAMCQIYWIDTFLQAAQVPRKWGIFNYYATLLSTSYVLKVLGNFGNGTNWENSPTFPRVTLCDFEVRALGQNQQFTVQCVLPINLFNEKIFLFLWIWVCFVCLMTITNLLLWLSRIAFQCSRRWYIMKHLKLMGKFHEENATHNKLILKKMAKIFINDYLRPDGIFLLRLMSINTNCLIASEIIGSLWDIFLEEEKVKRVIDSLYVRYRRKGLIKEIDEGLERDKHRARCKSAQSDQCSSHSTNPSIQLKRRINTKADFYQPPISAGEEASHGKDVYTFEGDPRKMYPPQQFTEQQNYLGVNVSGVALAKQKKQSKKGKIMNCFWATESSSEESEIEGVTIEKQPTVDLIERRISLEYDSDNGEGSGEEDREQYQKKRKNKRTGRCLRLCGGGRGNGSTQSEENGDGNEDSCSIQSSLNHEHAQDMGQFMAHHQPSAPRLVQQPETSQFVISPAMRHAQPPAYCAVVLDQNLPHLKGVQSVSSINIV